MKNKEVELYYTDNNLRTIKNTLMSITSCSEAIEFFMKADSNKSELYLI